MFYRSICPVSSPFDYMHAYRVAIYQRPQALYALPAHQHRWRGWCCVYGSGLFLHSRSRAVPGTCEFFLERTEFMAAVWLLIRWRTIQIARIDSRVESGAQQGTTIRSKARWRTLLYIGVANLRDNLKDHTSDSGDQRSSRRTKLCPACSRLGK